jgi:hypothetical protein
MGVPCGGATTGTDLFVTEGHPWEGQAAYTECYRSLEIA